MSATIPLIEYLKLYAHISGEDYAMAKEYFYTKTYKKGDCIPLEDSAAKTMIYIDKGLFRAFYIDPKSGKEMNSYFYQENQIMISFLIFTPKKPCNYFIEALEDSEATSIDYSNLKKLYKASHPWEHFGRLLAERYYRGANKRTESFIFNTPEERYLNLIKDFPKIFQRTSLINISSYLGVESQSLSRIRKRIVHQK